VAVEYYKLGGGRARMKVYVPWHSASRNGQTARRGSRQRAVKGDVTGGKVNQQPGR
jgi:hypothetical protein